MNMTMQPTSFSYPFYTNTPRLPISIPMAATRFPPPFIYPQSHDIFARKIPSSSSFTNTRYHHLKQSSRRSASRHSFHPDFIQTEPYRPSKTKSISDLEQFSRSNSAQLLKAHSWHAMANQHHRSNLSVGYANEMSLTPKSRRKYSPQRKKIKSPQRRLPSSPKRKASFRKHRQRTIPLPERGVVRISTLDEMPVVNHRVNQRTNSSNADRISTKGSISNSSKRRIKSKADNRSIQSNNQDNGRTKIRNDGCFNAQYLEDPPIDSDAQSSSSNYSHLSLQHRLNGSLRNDPLISAAMEDYRELQRSSSQATSLNSRRHHHHLSRESLRSNSTLLSSSSSSSPSDNQSQSSFTSLERSEIRQLIKTIKSKETKPLNHPLHSSPIPFSSEESVSNESPPPVSTIKARKSSLTEELDREFNRLRSLNPEQEINRVTPSSICKRKKTLEKPASSMPPLPTFDELLRKVQLRPVDQSIKPVYVKEKSVDEHYENPLLSVPVPRSSPIPVDEAKIEEPKHEYAVPNRRSLPRISHFQPSRSMKFNPSIPPFKPSKRTSRSLSMLNWLHSNFANPFPTTFQPDQINDHPIEYATAGAKENIYASNTDVYSPISTIEKTNDDDDRSLQIHLENQTIQTDDFYSDYLTKQTTTSTSILDDFSHLFTRKHKLQKKSQRCSIM